MSEKAPTLFELRPVLAKLGMSGRKLAKLLRVPQVQVTRWTTGRYAPAWESVCSIADALGVSLGVFRPGDDAHTRFFRQKGVPK
jgi:transcriptional regulator with XRE-family HTH domain